MPQARRFDPLLYICREGLNNAQTSEVGRLSTGRGGLLLCLALLVVIAIAETTDHISVCRCLAESCTSRRKQSDATISNPMAVMKSGTTTTVRLS